MRPRADRMLTPAWRRVGATAIDYALVLVWLALLTAVAFGLRRTGRMPTVLLDSGASRILAQAIVALVLTVPVTVGLSLWEAKRGATPGKRVMGLYVEGDDGRRASIPRALLRSTVKVALPWELGHAALWQTIGHDASPLTFVLLGMTYVVSGVHMALLCFGGRPLYDRAARTIVRRSVDRADRRGCSG